MDSARPERLTGPTNELAKERNRAAAERTLNAWVQNCLTLIGFGIAVDQISQALAVRAQANNMLVDETFAPILSLGFIVLGIGLLGIALVQYRLEITSIEQADYVLLSVGRLNKIVVGAIVVFGILSGLVLLISIQPS
jgi:putative membrane protein